MMYPLMIKTVSLGENYYPLYGTNYDQGSSIAPVDLKTLHHPWVDINNPISMTYWLHLRGNLGIYVHEYFKNLSFI